MEEKANSQELDVDSKEVLGPAGEGGSFGQLRVIFKFGNCGEGARIGAERNGQGQERRRHNHAN